MQKQTFTLTILTLFISCGFAFSAPDTPETRRHEAERYLQATPPKALFEDMADKMAANLPPGQRDPSTPTPSGVFVLFFEPAYERDFPKHCDASARRRNFSRSSRVARRVSGEQTFSGQALRSAGRRGLDPTLARLYKKLRSLPLLSRVPAMKAPSPSRSRWHRFWRLNVPGSNSRLISLPSL